MKSPRWQYKALKFIWTQRRDELVKACARYPNSDKYTARSIELQELNKKLEELEAD